MLYTIMPLDAIFPPDGDPPPAYPWWVDGRLCLVRWGKDGVPRLERLLSTDPLDFLDQHYQPDRPLIRPF